MPTADPAQQRALLAVQALDTRVRQVRHRGNSLPEHGELTELGGRHTELTGQRDVVAATVAGLKKDLTAAEDAVQQVRARRDRDQGRLDAGQGSADTLTALQHEIATLTARQSDLEDAELEVMEALETASAEQDGLDTQLAELDIRIADATGRRDTALAQVDAELADLTGQREQAVGPLDQALVTLYEKVIARSGGVGAAELTGNRCGACRIEISPADLAAVHAAPERAIVQCEECGAILVRTG